MKSFFSHLGNLSVYVPRSSSTLKTLVRFIVELLKKLNTKIVDELMKFYVMGYFQPQNKIYPPTGSAKSFPWVPIDYLPYYCSRNEPKLTFDFEMVIQLSQMDKTLSPQGKCESTPVPIGSNWFIFSIILPSMNENWGFNLPPGIARERMDEWMDGWVGRWFFTSFDFP